MKSNLLMLKSDKHKNSKDSNNRKLKKFNVKHTSFHPLFVYDLRL